MFNSLCNVVDYFTILGDMAHTTCYILRLECVV
jgi:hypothetical protein